MVRGINFRKAAGIYFSSVPYTFVLFQIELESKMATCWYQKIAYLPCSITAVIYGICDSVLYKSVRHEFQCSYFATYY